MRRTENRKNFEHHALEHVLSFQRRVAACKKNFMVRGQVTALGHMVDYWDRTEAQQRGTLHSHILCWFKRTMLHRHWKALDPVPRTLPGTEHKQRPLEQRILPLPVEDFREDSVYQHVELARVSAEMPRTDVSGATFGGHSVQTLRIAGLARTVLIRLNYLHQCTPAYCLKNRSACRFFFPNLP